MKLKCRDFTIQTEMFEFPVYIRDYDLISFLYKPKGRGTIGQELTLNLEFNSPEDAREAYIRIMAELGKGERAECNLSEFSCSWPTRLAKRIESYQKAYLLSL